jgi:predicted DNA-binding WGR domain protein
MDVVALRRIEPEKNMARFYAIDIERTLFGEWAVVRSWGRIGTRGRQHEVWLPGFEAAFAIADNLAATKRLRGYREATC